MSQAVAKSINNKSYKVHRDARTGRFVAKATARRRPASTKTETFVVKRKVRPKSAKVIGDSNVKYRKALGRLAKR